MRQKFLITQHSVKNELNIRKHVKTKCYNRDVTFSVDNTVYAGTIQNIGHYGATISANNPLNIPEVKKIRINILSQNQKEVKSAEIFWSEESSFGAKFF